MTTAAPPPPSPSSPSSDRSGLALWDQRFDRDDYLFGEAPNAFLARQAVRLPRGGTALAVADGEGRNGVWMAEQGLAVVSVDGSAVAQAKARRLADLRGVTLDLRLADLAAWDWPQAAFDVVAGIFIQFAGPKLRSRLFAGMIQALKPGGLLLLEGYGPRQLDYRTGGPSVAENLYTPDLLAEAFSSLEILELADYDAEVSEGAGHAGRSHLVDLVARRPR
ncbi:MAG: class I SAM-dependent methyltransferase [Alphaproteobacteria bacterium]|nr:class I SAM-dependent methyltransferase [Alphaproteobacteria bacterium]